MAPCRACRYRWVSSGMSSQCNSWCISRDSPWSNFLVSLTTRAAAFNTRCSLSVIVFGVAARIAFNNQHATSRRREWVSPPNQRQASIASSKIDCSIPHHWWAAVSIHPHYGFVCGIHRHDAAWQPRSRNSRNWDLCCLKATGWTQESLAFHDAAVTRARGAVCWYSLSCCTNKVLTRYSAYCWQQYDVIMTSWSNFEEVSKRHHQNFLLCNNNEITAYIADFFQQFLRRSVAYVVAFFKLLQQQTIGKVENSIMCLSADNFCLQQWKYY